MRISPLVLALGTLGLACAALLSVPRLALARQNDKPEKPRQFVYFLHLAPRFYEEKAWTPDDKAAVVRHLDRLKAAAQHGPVILAGRTDEASDKTLGIVIFEAPDANAARLFMENDPAVKAGVMTADLHPYIPAVQRSP